MPTVNYSQPYVPAPAPLSPADTAAKQRMALAEQLMRSDSSPVYSPAAGLARVAQNAFGGWLAHDAEKERQKALNQSGQDQAAFFSPGGSSDASAAQSFMANTGGSFWNTPWAQEGIAQGMANGATAGAAAASQAPNMFSGFADALGAFKWSDRRLKKDVERIGTLESGLPLYRYRYASGGPSQVGVMADEVAQFSPDAVVSVDGHLAVDYRKVR